MKAASCNSCGAAIVWIKTAGGKSMPCNANPIYYIKKPKSGSKKVVTPNGEALSCEYTEDASKATGTGYIPHWSTCDNSDSFRKKSQSYRRREGYKQKLLAFDEKKKTIEREIEKDRKKF